MIVSRLCINFSRRIWSSDRKVNHSIQQKLICSKDRNQAKNAGGKWAAALVLRMRTRSYGAEGSTTADKAGSSNLETLDSLRESEADWGASQLWALEAMRKGHVGVPSDAMPVDSKKNSISSCVCHQCISNWLCELYVNATVADHVLGSELLSLSAAKAQADGSL
ncbi:hypothetical protein MPTK2_Ug00180 [Marchantia polymorpha subsp. ruderalis]